MIENLEGVIGKIEFFREFSPEEIQLMVGCAKNVVFEEGSEIFHAGDEAKIFYIVREGEVRLELQQLAKDSLVIQTVGEGEALGWSWLIAPYKWQFDAIAKTKVRAIAFSGDCLRKKCESDYKFGFFLMKKICQSSVKRLQQTRIQQLDVYRVPN